ncbi:MAG: DUF2184 domain-containing protein [Clostridia bacterium]|nr:DUF2184 domain-containing protein [Clostridia bacterium]
MAKKVHTHYDAADKRELVRSGLIDTLYKMPSLHFDSAEQASVFFARELDYIKTRTYDVQYPELSALKLFPVSSEADEGADTITFYTYDKTGWAKVISNYSTDLPRADVTGKPTTVQIRSIGDSYGYSVQEMRASRLAGKSLDTRKGENARYQIDYLTNVIAWKGNEDFGLMGVLSEGQDIPMYTLAEGASGSTRWMDKTADEIIEDVKGMKASISSLTANVEKPDTLVLPTDVYNYISMTRLPSTELVTVLEFLRRSIPDIKDIIPAVELNSNRIETNPYAASDGTGQGVAFFYTKSPEKLTLEIPMPFLQHPIQVRNLETVVPCEARIAGVIVYYPMSAMIAVGV